jgi:hypothetical protein
MHEHELVEAVLVKIGLVKIGGCVAGVHRVLMSKRYMHRAK